MKAVICDICKRTQEDLANQMAHIRHFKMSTWSWLTYNSAGEREFDICDCCMKKIREQMRGISNG